jgi:hypothetical protein
MRIRCALCGGNTHARTTPYRGVRSMRAHSQGAEMSAFDELFKKIEGESIPGGCDQCEAYQIVEELSPGVHSLNIHHDDNCPVLRASRSKAN